jgi:triosephosphate isomerase
MKKYVIANWKMNPQTIDEAQALFDSVCEGLGGEDQEKLEVVICPPHIFLSEFQRKAMNVKLGGQDCFWENQGAFTGEISASMLKESGCEYVIVGHSERRIHFGETDEMVAKKVQAAMAVDLKVVLCIGEELDQRKAGHTREVIERQLAIALRDIKNLKSEIGHLLVAYEPIWAISSFNGHIASSQTTIEATNWIREFLEKQFGEQGRDIPVLYGGSVNAANANEHVCESLTDGFLVGSASLNAKEFLRIVEISRC